MTKLDFIESGNLNDFNKIIIFIHGWKGNKKSFKSLPSIIKVPNAKWVFPQAPYKMNNSSNDYSWSFQNSDGSYNFDNVNYAFREGTSNQTKINGFDKAATTVSVNRQVIKDNPNIGETETVATSDSVDVVRVIVKIPALQNINDEGDILGTEVQLKIQMSVDGGGFTDKLTDTITGRTGDAYKRDYEIGLPSTFSSEVKIRVIRLTDNADGGGRLSNQTWWDSYVRITYTNNTYPNSALAGIRIDAEQFPSIPRRAYLIRGTKIRIPSNATVDSATGALIYSGTWNGTFDLIRVLIVAGGALDGTATYSVWVKDGDGLKNQQIITNEVINGDYQSLAGGLEIRFAGSTDSTQAAANDEWEIEVFGRNEVVDVSEGKAVKMTRTGRASYKRKYN